MKKFEEAAVIEIAGKDLIRKNKVLDMLKYKLTRNEKKIKDADNEEQRRKLQYQREELIVIIENVENM